MSVESKRPLKLVAVDSNLATAQAIKTHFADKGVRVIGEAANLKTGMRIVRGLQPNLVLLEVPAGSPDETLEAVRSIRAEMPQCGIILSADSASPQLILTGVRAGAQEFVGRPVDLEELEAAIEHVRRRIDGRTAAGRRRCSLISVFSSKGGSGCSMVATNLAVALAKRPEARVVLVDLNFQLGDLELMLDVAPRYG